MIMKKFWFLYLLLFYGFTSIAQTKISVLEHNSNITISRLDSLNTEYRETNISVSPDGKYLFFMSNRGGQKWNQRASSYYKQAGFDGDIWYSKQINGIWTKAKAINSPINSPEGEDEPVISPDGQTIFYQSWADGWKKNGGPYYKAELNGNSWQNITGLGDSISNFFIDIFKIENQAATDGMAISPDGKLFIVAYNKSLNLPMDLYYSRKIGDTWMSLKPMKINTDFDERSVFIGADGKSIYFASNGYGGFGGLDIFKTTLDDDGDFGKIINIGKPFNTEKDDYSFILTASGNRAYFVRDGDIFQADISDANSSLKPLATKIISGTIKNTSEDLLTVKIDLIDSKTKQIITTSNSNSISGEFSLLSPITKGKYELTIHFTKDSTIVIPIEFANENLFESFEFDITTNSINKLVQVTSLVTVNFDYNKDILKDCYKNTINKAIQSFPTANIKDISICGFTDSDGSSDYNIQLGLKRAQSVSKHLNSIKIDAHKIESKGKLNPVSSNNSTDGKSANRRVEVKITWLFL